MNSVTTSENRAIEIDWFDEKETISVNPRDQRRFEIQKDRAIELLRQGKAAESQLRYLIERVGRWFREHAEKLDAGYLTMRGDRFAFIAISKVATCDDELEDAISDLDFSIANDQDLEMVPMNAMILPPATEDALRSFLDPRFLMVMRRGQRS